jgi:hypothetical protein
MPDNRGRLVAAVTCVLLTAAGCAAGGGDEPPAAARGGVGPTTPAEVGPVPLLTVDRTHRIDAIVAPADTSTVVLGGVALETTRKLRAADAGGTDRLRPLFAKTGLVVRDGAVVDIVVEGRDSDNAVVGWGNGLPGGASSVRVPGCAGGAAAQRWAVFSGGYWVDEPRCVAVTVRAHGEQARVRVPVGTDC